MTDLIPGSRWLLPVEVFDVVGFPGGDVHKIIVQTIGDDYFKLYDEDVASLIPADRITELEAEVARWRRLYDDASAANSDMQKRNLEQMAKRNATNAHDQ